MKSRFNVFQRLLSVVLTLALVIGLAPAISTTASGAVNDLRIFSNKTADPSTMDWENYFGENVGNTRFAGMVWSDKSVYKEESNELPGITRTDENNFLVSLSAIASNLAITGHTTAPTDTMLVLDLSASMIPTYEVGTIRQQGFGNNYRYTTVNGRNVSLVQAMVDATNAAIDELMSQNPNNRVGVVLFSGNTSTGDDATTDTATVVLPLARYTGVSNGTANEYLQMNATWQENVTIYERSGYGPNSSWQSAGTVDYVATGSSVSVSVKEGLTSGNDAVAVKSKTVAGGTYTQNGLYQALNEFEKVTDTRVPDGKTQAGADRVPAIVLMTDGAPTIADSDYSGLGTSNTGTGSGENEMITFLTQLTAAYVRGAVSAKYTEEGAAEAQKVLFLTLGLGTRNSTGATNTLYPAGTTGNVATAWDTYLSMSNGASSNFSLGGYTRSITREDAVAEMNYVDKYYYADDATSLIGSFEQIIDEIELKAESYATLVENVGANFSGYVTFEDELGELMEVSDMKGILIGNHLYTGEELAKGMTEGNLGTPEQANEKGDELIRTVKERIPGTDTTAAQQLVHNAYLDKQLYWENANSWSNYIGWYAKEDGTYAGFWDKDSGYENAPADALYANKSYGYLGENGNSDMMHVVVMVRTNLKTLHQTVVFKIPAALLPTVTYHVTLDENDPDAVKDFSVEATEKPMQVVFEVGLRADINSVNLEQKLQAYMANTENENRHIHRNADGSVSLFTNAWGSDNDTDNDGVVDYNEALTAKVAVSHFHPALDNGRYYYTADTLVLDANGDPVTTATRPTDTDSDPENGTGYHHDHYIYSSTERTTIDMAITAATLEKAQQNAAGQWYIPAGTIYQELSRFRNPKQPNRTGTLDYSDYAAIFGVGEKQDVYNFLGNNGSISIAPATGIALTKAVADGLAAAGPYTFLVSLSGIPAGQSAAPVLTDANGEALTNVTMSAYENGSFTVTMPANVEAYITGIPVGTTVTVTEQIAGDYKLTGATVDGAPAAVVGNSVSLTVPAYDAQNPVKQIVPVTLTNAPNGYGDLVIEKEVVHDLTEDPAALANKEFTFRVKLEGDKIVPGTSSFATGNGGSVTVGADGTFTVTLKNDEAVTILNIPEGTVYTVTEEGIPDGFKLDSVNADQAATAATGAILARQTQLADFVNRYPDEYVPVTVPVSVDVTKILTQLSTYTGDEEFTFALQKLLADQTHPDIVTVKAKAGETKTLLADQTFDKVGIYQYRVVEIKPDPATPGMTYSTQQSLFVVEVTDNDMDGRLEVKVRDEAHTTVNASYTDGDDEQITAIHVQTAFTNVFEHGSAALNVNVHKDLTNDTGVNISRTQFQFEMVASDDQGEPLPGAQTLTVNTSALGDATFHTVLEIANTHYFRIRETIPAEAVLDAASGKYVLNGMYYDPSAYLVTVTTEVNGASELVITRQTMVKLGDASATDVDTAVFTNEYKLTQTSASFSLKKTLNGRAAGAGETFQAYLTRTNGAFVELPGTDPDRWIAWYTMHPGNASNVRLNFTKAGTYHYKLTEQIPTGDTKGITYDTAAYHITITVRDNGDGTLVADTPVIHKQGSSAQVNVAEFVNTYTVTGEEQIVLSGLKDLDGRRLVAGEFEFVLYDEDGRELDAVRNLADGSFTFKALRFTPAYLGADNAAKTYTYTVKETKNGLGGVEYATTVYTVKVTVSHEGGKLTVAQTMEKDGVPYTGQILFENTYKADDVTVTLRGSKVLSGDWSVADKTFTFHLHEANAAFQITNGTPETVSVSSNDYTNGTAAFTFQLPVFEDGEEGFYYYVLHEDTTPAAGGVGYDAGEYHITVNVSDPGDGKLVAMVSMYRPGTGNIADDPALHTPIAVFTNAYSVEPEAFRLTGTKTLTGRDMAAGEFEFLVLDTSGAVVSRGTNAAASDGEKAAIIFDQITYTAPGTHTYTVVEELGDLGGVDYDSEKVYTLQVTVADNGNGRLSVSYTVDGDANKQIAFENTYSVTSEDLYLTGTKTLTGDWSKVPAANKVFTFHILEGNTVKSVGSADLSVSNTITFQKLTFNTAGTYNYKIVEVDDGKGGIGYSDKEYALVVTVTDNGDGTLGVAYTVDGVANGNISYENSYAIINNYSIWPVAYKSYTNALTGGEFRFRLSGDIGSQVVDQTEFNDQNGNVQFDEVVFTQPGTYTLKVEEIDKFLGFIEYSRATYEIIVTVVDNGEGALVGNYVINKTGIHLAQEDNLIFVNTYDPGDATVSFFGQKDVAGSTGAVAPFTFALYETGSTYDITGVTPVTKNNAPNGNFSFETITYAQTGTHYYVIRELPGTDPEMVYDGAEFRFKVEIIDEGMLTPTIGDDGQLKPVITDESAVAATVVNGNTDASAQVDFTNAPFEEVAKKEVFAANTSTKINGQKVNVGDELRYEITYTNYTGKTVDVQIEDTLPAYTTLVSGSAAGAVISGDKLTWTFNDVAPDAVIKVEFSVTVDAPDTFYTNQAIVRDGINEYTTNETHNHTIEEIILKDAALETAPTISIDGKKVSVGDVLEYTITYANTTDQIVSATLTDKIPAYTELFKVYNSGVYSAADREITWTKDVAPWTVWEVSFQVKVTQADGEIVNKATVFDGRNTYDSNEVTNHSYDDLGDKDVYYPSAPSISIDGRKVNVGDVIEYKISYVNHTGKDVTVTITDKIPAHTTLVTGSAGSAVISGDTLTWTENVPKGGNTEVTFQVKVDDADVQLKNKATVLEGEHRSDTNEVTNHTYEELGDKEVFSAKDPTLKIDGKPVSVGDELIYTITYTNYTGKDAQVTITDNIPKYTTYVEGSAQNATYADGVLTWANIPVAKDGTVTVSFKVKVAQLGGTVSNQAMILEGGNWYGTDTVTNAIVEKTVDKQTATLGEILTYTIRYINTTGAAADVTITDKLDANLIPVEDSIKGVDYKNGTLTWVVRNVPAGDTVEVSFQAKIKAAAGVSAVSNQATVVVNDYEVKTNGVTTNVTAPVLQMTKTQAVGNGTAVNTKQTVVYGDTVTYYIQVSNTGTGKALGVKIVDRFPSGLIYKDGSVSAGGVVENGVVTWAIGELAPGAAVTVSFQVTVPGVAVDTEWKNVASVVADNDPDGPEAPTSSNQVVITEEGTDQPKTGDPTNLPLLFAVMFLSGAAMTALLLTTKKKEETA